MKKTPLRTLDPPGPAWPWLRSFVAVLESGSLTAAAARLHTTQPTVGRHIRALERQLGETLFDRRPGGLVPTARATGLYERAAAAEQAVTGLALSLQRGTAGSERAAQLAGVVRVTTSVIFAVELLPALMAPLLEQHAQLQIELTASDELRNLLRREADVAVRFVRPTQAEVVAMRVGELPIGLFAHRSYLERHGVPRRTSALADHTIVSSEDPQLFVQAAARQGVAIAAESVRLRCDSLLAQIAALRAGVGIGACQVWLAERHPELVRVLPRLVVGQLPVWVAAHDDLHRSRRIRTVFDHLVQQLRARFATGPAALTQRP